MTYAKFKIKRKIWSFKNSFQILDEDDQIVYQVTGNQFNPKTSYLLTDARNNECFSIRCKLWTIKNTFYISKDGQDVYKVKQSLGLKSELFVESLLEPDAFYVSGNLWGSEYKFIREDIEFAFVSKNVWKVVDTYGIAIDEKENIPLVLAIVIIIELIQQMSAG